MADGYSYSIFSHLFSPGAGPSVGGLSRREASHWPHAFPSSLVLEVFPSMLAKRVASLVGRQLTPKWHHDKKAPFFGTQKGNQDNGSMMDKELSRLSQRGQCFWDELLVWASWIRKWQPKMCKRELTFLEKENAVRMHQEQIVSPRPASATTNEFGGNISLLLNNFLFRCTNSSDVPKPVVATTTDYSHCATTTLLKKMML